MRISIVGGDDSGPPCRPVPRRSLDSQIEAGKQISPSGSAADAVHVHRQMRRERARPPRP